MFVRLFVLAALAVPMFAQVTVSVTLGPGATNPLLAQCTLNNITNPSFPVVSAALSMSNIVTFGGSTPGSGKASFGDLVINKVSDSCSIPMAMALVQGHPFNYIIVRFTDATLKTDILRMVVYNAYVTNFAVTGSTADSQTFHIQYAGLILRDVATGTNFSWCTTTNSSTCSAIFSIPGVTTP